MKAQTRLMVVQCLSPLHVGTGQGVGAVDLPITRESSTGLPYLPGSSIKGTLRDRSRQALTKPQEFALFGPETENASDHAGALVFGDARLLCLPVRSVHGTFAWATSPLLLQRLLRDVREVDGLDLATPLDKLSVSSVAKARAPHATHLTNSKQRAFLEDLDLAVEPCAETEKLARALAELLFDDASERASFINRFIILHDDALSFLSRHAIEVVTRSSIDAETKTVKRGQLWTEENLPTESILVGLILENGHLNKSRAEGKALELLPTLLKGSVQFGGHATIGRGRCRVTLKGGA